MYTLTVDWKEKSQRETETVYCNDAEQMLMRITSYVMLTYKKGSAYYGFTVKVHKGTELIITTGKGAE